MMTDQELEEGLKRANCVIKLLKEHSLFDEDDHVCGFRTWATPECVVGLIREIQTWRMVHGMDLDNPGL